MLVVPGKASLILFGNNYLAATDAIVLHAKLKVHFGHPSLNCKIEGRSNNPVLAFPNLDHRTVPSAASDVSPHPQQQPSANVTCLFSGLSPSHQAHRNVRLCIVVLILFLFCLLLTTTSTLGSTMCGSNFWLEGKQVASGIEVLTLFGLGFLPT